MVNMRKIQYAGYYRSFYELEKKTSDWIPNSNAIEPQPGDVVVNFYMGLGWNDMIEELNRKNLKLEPYKNKWIIS
jgi:hypothetical protein